MDLRQIDALVAEHVMGKEVDWSEQPGSPWIISRRDAKGREFHSSPSPYSSDISSAWEVVDKLKSSGFKLASLTKRDADIYVCQLLSVDGEHGAYAPTAPLAICLAALAAKGIGDVCISEEVPK